MSGCRDLRHLNDSEDIMKAFSKLVSGGKAGYKTIIEKTKPTLKCGSCGSVLCGEGKFCPECGNKLK